MKNRIGLILLALLCAGLGVALLVTEDNLTKQKETATQEIAHHSNEWWTTHEQLEEQKQKTTMMESDLNNLTKITNNWARTIADLTNNLTQTSADLDKTRDALKASQDAVAQRDSRINDLQAQNNTLDQRAAELAGEITNLDSQISDVRHQLATARGDNAFLTGELKRLMADKAELEKQFNDIAVVRAQLASLRQKKAIERRLDWMRRGVYASFDEKGGQRLMEKNTNTVAAAASSAPTYDLNVEVNSDGTIKVIPALTNAPAATNPPAAK